MALAGAGGMGAVWRARDLESGAPVALKVLGPTRASEARRFRREAELLASIDHPSIVRYLAHGLDEAQRPWLAMEWLEGEDLAARLDRGPLALEEVVALGRRVCAALDILHARGVVHRDVKPGNLWLENGRCDGAVLIDLGVARPFERRTRLTGTNEVLGTVGYLAPEQVEGREPLGGRADLFALGCVLYECIAGRPAFAGPHPLAVLAQLMLVSPTPLGELREGLPGPLVTLVESMLAKDPDDRPSSARDVAARLVEVERVSPVATSAPTLQPPSTPPLGAKELRVSTFVLVEPRPIAAAAETCAEGASARERVEADAMAAAAGTELRWSSRSFALALVDAGDTPGDRAARAAHLALELAARPWVLRVVVTTGRVERSEPLSAGVFAERAALLLERTSGPEGAFVDAPTEALLGGQVRLSGPPGMRRIVGRGDGAWAPRPVLGKVLPCLGRAREIGVLGASHAATIEERRARVVLVVGAAGVGKSRLVAEWMSRLAPGVVRARATADVISRGPLHLVEQLVRSSFARLAEEVGEELGEVADGALARCAAAMGVADGRLVPFLADLAGLPWDEREQGPARRAARNDPRLHAEWLERAFMAWLDAATRAPAVFVLEDLAWADDTSIAWLDRALRRFEDRPLLVVATARPSFEERFPRLWEESAVDRVAVGRLAHAVARELVDRVAEDHLGERARADIVDRAQGHPFLLEELVRHAVQGDGAALPDSVLAIVQRRLERLVDVDRRLLRLASVLGERFASADLAALAGGDVRLGLSALERAELVCPGEEPDRWAFRHALVRDAASESMPEEDRRRAHGEVADLLAARGEGPDAVAIHLEAAGRGPEAAVALVAAARRALERGAPATAMALAERAAPLADEDRVRARAWAYASGAASMLGDLPRAAALGGAAMEVLPVATEEWFMAAYGPSLASYQLDTSRVPAVTSALLATPPAAVPPTILSAYAFSACILVLYGVAGMRPAAQAIARLGVEVAEAHGFEAEPFLRPLETVLAVVGLREDDVAEGRRRAAGAMAWCEAVGAEGLSHMAQPFASLAAVEVGRGLDSLEALRAAEAGLLDRGNLQHAHWASSVELRVLASAGGGPGAEEALARRVEPPSPYHAGWYETQRALLVAETGSLAEARAIVDPFLGGTFALFDAFARSVAARAAIAGERFAEALEHVAAFDALAAEGQAYPLERTFVDLARVAALRGLGRADDAEAALRAALARLADRGARLEPGDRRAFEALAPSRGLRALAP